MEYVLGNLAKFQTNNLIIGFLYYYSLLISQFSNELLPTWR